MHLWNLNPSCAFGLFGRALHRRSTLCSTQQAIFNTGSKPI